MVHIIAGFSDGSYQILTEANQNITKMKLFALVATAAVAMEYPEPEALQGTREDGEQWSVYVGPNGLAYQEGGQSIVAMPGTPTSSAIGVSTFCFDLPNPAGCVTAPTAYQNYSWDGQNLSVAGKDSVGLFTITGSKNADGGMDLTKTYSGVQGPLAGLVVNIVSNKAPTESGLLFDSFTFTSNKGPMFQGSGRNAAAFVDPPAQTSFDSVIAQPQDE